MNTSNSIPTLSAPIPFKLSAIPNHSDFDNQTSSFFQRGNQLPSPHEVRSQAEVQHDTDQTPDKRRTYSPDGPNYNPPPVLFESMNLFVKWGSGVEIAEGRALFAVQHFLQDAVPVPEIYGWRTDGDEVFLYMEAIKGQSLDQVWEGMGDDRRISVCEQLRKIFTNLRWLKQDHSEKFVGNITRGPIYDRSIHQEYFAEAGPFISVKGFHDWFTFLPRRRMSDPHSIPIEPFRHLLSDDSEIVFTHGDLHRSNILVTLSNPPKVTAIVDWEQTGWLPAYWEDRKAHWTADYTGEWSEKYLPMILDQYPDTWDPWDYYTSSMGC